MRTIVMTDADHQRIEQGLSDDLLVARKERAVLVRRIDELERENGALKQALSSAGPTDDTV